MSRSYSDRSHARNSVLQRMGEGQVTWNKRICPLPAWDKERKKGNRIFVLRWINGELLLLLLRLLRLQQRGQNKAITKSVRVFKRIKEESMGVRRIEDRKKK